VRRILQGCRAESPVALDQRKWYFAWPSFLLHQIEITLLKYKGQLTFRISNICNTLATSLCLFSGFGNFRRNCNLRLLTHDFLWSLLFAQVSVRTYEEAIQPGNFRTNEGSIKCRVITSQGNERWSGKSGKSPTLLGKFRVSRFVLLDINQKRIAFFRYLVFGVILFCSRLECGLNCYTSNRVGFTFFSFLSDPLVTSIFRISLYYVRSAVGRSICWMSSAVIFWATIFMSCDYIMEVIS